MPEDDAHLPRLKLGSHTLYFAKSLDQTLPPLIPGLPAVSTTLQPIAPSSATPPEPSLPSPSIIDDENCDGGHYLAHTDIDDDDDKPKAGKIEPSTKKEAESTLYKLSERYEQFYEEARQARIETNEKEEMYLAEVSGTFTLCVLSALSTVSISPHPIRT